MNPVDLTGAIEPHPATFRLAPGHQRRGGRHPARHRPDETIRAQARHRTDRHGRRLQPCTVGYGNALRRGFGSGYGNRRPECSGTSNKRFQAGRQQVHNLFRLLGIVPTETHTLTVDITFNNGDTQRVVSDLTEAIRDFNNGTKPVKLTGNLLLPVEAGVTGATITGWNEVESGNGDAN